MNFLSYKCCFSFLWVIYYYTLLSTNYSALIIFSGKIYSRTINSSEFIVTFILLVSFDIIRLIISWSTYRSFIMRENFQIYYTDYILKDTFAIYNIDNATCNIALIVHYIQEWFFLFAKNAILIRHSLMQKIYYRLNSGFCLLRPYLILNSCFIKRNNWKM